MTNSSSFYFETPYFLIPWGLVMLLLSLAGLIVYHFHKQKDYNLFLTYIASLDVSLIIFCIATSLKCFLVGTKMVSFKYIRRGFFGVFERFFVLLRGVLCTFRWLCYFSNIWPIPTLMNFIARPKTTSCYIYIVMKCILLLWLLWDLAFSIQKYRVNSIVAVKAADPEKVVNECVICLNMPVEPVQLSCSHIFCYECAIRWLSLHPTCPMCAQPIAEQKYIEFSDGHIPLAALLSAY
ncbi:hypothetical protein TVAG_412210 [Trichomonas vaginalis G3]|uniref:RING-type domain-containing protein n=1 Tax=Trichomonas vaginalis (strain ATCC PRA-98 / G3) TaxID=412133 RepID=A2F1M7_TRIV3|nr:LP20373P family [Trichomonas vaginalis G3]EAY01192.1 hypothetical protein TVAG_412210 [Trichomonas vaginalis G3]KAI5513194.1 LP20373P family [Trichomonas vaginalis G3]|eukprot:XP_001314028.1 hypothetical protein [Trichomonas vaginalis G3]